MVRDHVDLMAQFELEERKMQEETEAVRVENAQMREQTRETSTKTEARKREAKEEYEKYSEEY